MPRPQLYVPQRRSNWRLTLLRLWVVIGLVISWLVFIDGTHELHFKAAVLTFGAWCMFALLVRWIFSPALPPEGDNG